MRKLPMCRSKKRKKAVLNLERQSGIIPRLRLHEPITVIGSGSIGSSLLLGLAKMGCQNLTVYDSDKVEDHNIANQFYRLKDIGKYKVKAAQDIVKIFSGTLLKIKNQRWKDQKLSGIICVSVDSMRTRKEVFEKAKYNALINLLIEGRMGGLVGYVYCIKPFDPDDIKFYEKALYSDAEAEVLPCTQETIIFNVQFLSSLMCALLASYWRGEVPPREVSMDLANFNFLKRR